MLREAMKVRYQLAISLDGLIAPEDGSIDWLDPYGAVGMEIMRAFMKEVGGVIMGRATYDQAAAMGGGMYGSMPALIMTSRPLLDAKAGIVVAGGAPRPALEKLRGKVKKGDLWLIGGGETAGRFLDADLIDMIELTMVPVALAAGRPLFAGAAAPKTFKLISSTHGKLGTVTSIYARP
jgi:dihydrofolate reductase